jgi:hypothetical protein
LSDLVNGQVGIEAKDVGDDEVPLLPDVHQKGSQFGLVHSVQALELQKAGLPDGLFSNPKPP